MFHQLLNDLIVIKEFTNYLYPYKYNKPVFIINNSVFTFKSTDLVYINYNVWKKTSPDHNDNIHLLIDKMALKTLNQKIQYIACFGCNDFRPLNNTCDVYFCDQCNDNYGKINLIHPVLLNYNALKTGIVDIYGVFFLISRDSLLLLFKYKDKPCYDTYIFEYRKDISVCSIHKSFTMIYNFKTGNNPIGHCLCSQIYRDGNRLCSACCHIVQIKLSKIIIPLLQIINRFDVPNDIKNYIKIMLKMLPC